MDYSMAEQKFYKGFSFNMLTLSEKGIQQIIECSKNEKLKNAELIITSPYGRTMHSAAILSKELNIDMKVETDGKSFSISEIFTFCNELPNVEMPTNIAKKDIDISLITGIK